MTDPGGSGFISADLAVTGVLKSGYNVSVGAGGSAATGTPACNAAAPNLGYVAWADPASLSTGTRSFGTNGTGTIRADPAGATYAAMTASQVPGNGAPIQ